jgi:hypothetical protein
LVLRDGLLGTAREERRGHPKPAAQLLRIKMTGWDLNSSPNPSSFSFSRDFLKAD